MGGERHNIKEKIIEKVKTSSINEITIEKLKKTIKDTYFPDLSEKNYNKAFLRDFNKLLDIQEIKIIGYDFDEERKPKQSFNFEPILIKHFKRKTRPDINDLLNKMDGNNESYQEIRRLFKKKLEDLEKFYSSRWSSLKGGTFAVTPNEIRDIASYFGFYQSIEDMISDLSEEQKKEFIEYWYGDNNRANEDLVYDVSSSIDYIIEEVQDRREEKDLSEHRNMHDELYYGIEEDSEGKIWEEDSYDMYEVEEMIKDMARILIFIDRYERKWSKIWIYPVYTFQFNNIWFDMPKKTYKLLDTMLFIEGYNLEIDEYGFWNEDLALSHAGYKKPTTEIKNQNYDKHFEHMIDIISTYPDEQKRILLGILAKGLSDEPGSIQIFGEFFKKISSIDYPERLNNILKGISVYPESISYDEFKQLKEDNKRLKQVKN